MKKKTLSEPKSIKGGALLVRPAVQELYGEQFEHAKILMEYNILTLTEEDRQILVYVAKRNYSPDFFNDLDDFNKGCETISKILNERSVPGKEIIVIAPGDSPSKIVRYLEILMKDVSCQFISFSLSNMFENCNEEDAISYIASYIPDGNIENIILLDYIATGSTVRAFMNALIHKCKDASEELISRIEGLISRIQIDLDRLLRYIDSDRIDIP